MSYSKSVFFIPVWLHEYSSFVKALQASAKWGKTDIRRYSPGYLFHYAANIANSEKLYSSFTYLETENLNVYMFANELKIAQKPRIEEVRVSCFETGVGFLEFWVNHDGLSIEDISDFSYLFKKAAKRNSWEMPGGMTALYDAAATLLSKIGKAKLFFSAAAPYKYECNCFHFVHLDENIPDEQELHSKLYRLSRSYKRTMPVSYESKYDVVYEASRGDYWAGSTEGLVNIVYDYGHEENNGADYYLHSLKLQHLSVDYYFMYLLLLHQKYASIEYIHLVSSVLDGNTAYVENLNRRIVQLKNCFSFNVISDDRVFQNVYSQMYEVLEIKSLLGDVIENESQMEYLQKAKHIQTDRMSNKYLMGISILSLFSALVDSATYYDRFGHANAFSTWMSGLSVAAVIAICIAWMIRSARK